MNNASSCLHARPRKAQAERGSAKHYAEANRRRLSQTR